MWRTLSFGHFGVNCSVSSRDRLEGGSTAVQQPGGVFSTLDSGSSTLLRAAGCGTSSSLSSF